MENRIRVTRLREAIKDYDSIIIYGAGQMAKAIYKELIKNNFFPLFCVVSNKEKNNDTFENIPLHAITDCISEMRRDGVVTFIAVTELYEKEIEEVLRQHNIHNYIFMTEYIYAKSFCQMETEEEYLDKIAEWHVEKHNLEVKDIELTKRKLKDLIQGKCEKDKIVFVVAWIAPRVVKIANALCKNGYVIEVLFCPDIWNRKTLKNKLINICDTCTDCHSLEELMYCIMESKAKVVHIFSDICHSHIGYILIKKKRMFGKVIFDQYDIADGMYVDTYASKETYFYERYCIENADGLCCRGYEQKYLVNKKDYKIKGKTIKFFDYCWAVTENTNYYEELYNKEKPLTLCYAGGIATEKEWPEAPYACFLEFASTCEKNKCHFHVYPSDWDEVRFKEYIELDNISEYFHFHKPVEYEKLSSELSQYDYGVHLIKKGFLEKEIVGYNTRNKLIYGVTNHFYDYIDAEIPIIAAAPLMFVDFFEKEEVLINWTVEEFNFELLIQMRDKLHKKVVEVKKKLQIDRHIGELTELYNSI